MTARIVALALVDRILCCLARAATTKKVTA
ncbi:hypothetical protein FHR32_000320 [Streptosporangium album]|uniref:Uncharacterized protein n=1 Tax=Streptosporangium album TaxID=47479 RepID=A0A7W7W7K4_9ACTN|nr:hypothetical protein [Streptosporangium album]